MIQIIGLVDGPFADEGSFQSACLPVLFSLAPKAGKWFPIESEETVPGFPDTIRISRGLPSKLIEYKIVKPDGKIHFQRSQPLFYRQNVQLDIIVLIWDGRRNRVLMMQASEVLAAKKLRIPVPEFLIVGGVYSARSIV
jgi:hypothetical protein